MVWLDPRNLNCHKAAAEVLEHRAREAFSATAGSSQRTLEGLVGAGASVRGVRPRGQVRTGLARFGQELVERGRQLGLSDPCGVGARAWRLRSQLCPCPLPRFLCM